MIDSWYFANKDQPVGPFKLAELEALLVEEFTAQVMGQVLGPICANCHVPGGAAAAANFRVTSGDLLATQTSVDLQIDPANPLESRILTKPGFSKFIRERAQRGLL